MIDVRQILDELGVDYKADGKNVGANDINIDCPFCASEKHLGISLGNGYVNCWVCGFEDFEKRPSLAKILVESTGLQWGEVIETMKEHGWVPFQYEVEEPGNGLASKAWLPLEANAILKMMFYKQGSDEALDYLVSRLFHMNDVRRYKLHYANSGRYENRIIIPIFFNGKLAAFTSRLYKGEGSRNKHAPLYMSSERITNLLYNYDIAKSYTHIYLLEGPTDVWRMGKNSMAVFRSKLSRTQRKLLVNLAKKGLNSITIIFDKGATSRALIAAEDLSPFINRIKVVRIEDERDVADMTRNLVINLEKITPYFKG